MPKKLDVTILEIHPLAAMFPPIRSEDWDAFCHDIREHGVLEAIVIYQGKILDGRNRRTAALLVGRLDIPYVFLPDGVDPVAFVISKNMHRRHVEWSQTQRAAIAAKLRKWAVENGQPMQIPAKTRISEGVTITPSPNNTVSAKPTRENIAEAMGVSVSLLKKVEEVGEVSFEDLEAMAEGKETLREAGAKIAAKKNPPPKEEPFDDEPPSDRRGLPINIPELVPILSGAENNRFRDLHKRLKGIEKELETLRGTAIGRFVSQQAAIDVRNAATAVKFAAPHSTCVYCRGSCACKACGPENVRKPGAFKGWITRSIWQAAPDAMKQENAEPA